MTDPQQRLLQLTRAEDVGEAQSLAVSLEAECGFGWRAVGDRENNFGQINIGSDPGFALIERVTNAIDGVLEGAYALERRTQPSRKLPVTPREAAERWFQVPSGRVRNLSIPDRQKLADRIVISLHPGTEGKSHPTLRIRDLGVGLTPGLLPKTILALGEANKIDKPFLAGAYGQGGSTTFAFSPDGTLIVSRRQPDLLGDLPDLVSVSLVRFVELDPAINKNGRYEYLVGPDNRIPVLPASLLDFEAGTEVVHFNYDLSKYSAAMTQLTGSLWWLLQNALFDPILPLWAEDHRTKRTKKTSVERRSISGNHTRLWGDRNDKMEHADSVLVTLPHPTGDSRVIAHYWVAAVPEDVSSRVRPIDAYVDPYRPVTHTFFGQTHGTEDLRFVRDRLQLPYLDRFLILQIELDQLTPLARRSILSTTRDRLKASHLYDEMRERLAHALAEDPILIRLNEERREALLSSYSENERQRMRERFAKLLTNLLAGRDADVHSAGEEEGGRKQGGAKVREPLEPLPTGDRPTFLRIANAQKPVRVQVDRAAVLRLESDAPDGYLADHDPQAKLIVACDPEKAVAMESRSDFRGGRSRVLIRPGSDTKTDVEGDITVILLTPEGDTYQDRVSFRVVDPVEEPTAGRNKKGKVKSPEPIPIYKDKWPSVGWDEKSVAQVETDDTGVRILVNMDNRHIHKLLSSGGYKEKGLARMKNNYLLYCAYYSWLQHQALSTDDHGLHGEDFENYKEEELDRASQTVINAIAAEGRLD
jgi:hypothetical protein